MPLSPGACLGPYEIVAPLGAGGMGEVYRARDTRLRREVALKILPGDVAADEARRARFEQEAHAAAALNHPNSAAHAAHIVHRDVKPANVMITVDGRVKIWKQSSMRRCPPSRSRSSASRKEGSPASPMRSATRSASPG